MRADQPVEQRPPVGLLDMGARMVDQMHVVDAGRAGRHAGEAGQAAVDMGDDLGVGRPAVLQHVLDQVDAAARRIELVAERHIGRAGRRAEAAMHAFAQDLLGFRDMRIGELGEGEVGLHQVIRPGLRCLADRTAPSAAPRARRALAGCGSNAGIAARSAGGRAPASHGRRHGCATSRRTASASGSPSMRSQISPPCQS